MMILFFFLQCTEEQLQKAFKGCGEISEVKIPRNSGRLSVN